MKLYIYEYCPYCIKARMIFPLKHQPIELEVLLDDDLKTPTQLIGRKLLPILQKDDGTAMGESLDIVRYIDQLEGNTCLTGQRQRAVSAWCTAIESRVYALSMPRWAEMPVHEFSTPGAKAFYTRGKEAWLGDFKRLRQQTPALLAEIQTALAELAPLIKADDTVNGTLSLDDFSVFPLLQQLSVVKGISYPPRVEAYRRHMAARCQIPLYDHEAI